MSDPVLFIKDVTLEKGIKVPDISLSAGEVFWLECENNLTADVFVSFLLGALKIKQGSAVLSGVDISSKYDHKTISYCNINWSVGVDDVEKLVKLLAHSVDVPFSSAVNDFKRMLKGLGADYAANMKISQMTLSTKRMVTTAINIAMPALIVLLEEPFFDLGKDGAIFLEREIKKITSDGSSVFIMSEGAPPSYSKKIKFSCTGLA